MDETMEQAEYTADDLARLGQKWLERIRLSEKREDRWMKDAERAESIYLAGQCEEEAGEEPEFNILHSNVETIVPSIYNSTGKPDIRPRHNNPDPLSKLVSDVFERSILAMVDDSRMDAEVEASAQDVFVAGRGIVRVKFDADVIEQPVTMPDPMTGQPVPAVDETGQPVTQQIVTNERVEYENVSWRDFRMGPAKRWKEVPWVAFRHCITQEAIEKLEDAELASLQADPENAVKSEDDVTVWEIWCKDTGRVYFIVADNHKVLSVKDDPLGLPGFFPCAAPVQPITPTGKLTPVCPYRIYETLAGELETITERIRGLTEVLEAKGAMAGSGETLDKLAQAGDGEIVMLDDMENLMAQGGLEKAVMWWPIDRIIQVIRELNVQREQTKQAIYEITGISDIIRGQSSAQETATAQQIKTQWGSLRIKKMQRLIERQVRELFVLTTELISRHFSPDTLQKLAGMQIPQEALQLLQKPLDHYRIDVESNSTVAADLAQGRQEMAEFLGGTGQYFAAMAPLVQSSPALAEPVAEIYGSFARQFNLGKQAEDALDRLVAMAKQAAANPPPNPEAEAKKMEMEQQAALDQGRLQLDAQKLELDRQKLSLEAQKIAGENQVKAVEAGAKQGEAVAMAGQMMAQVMAQAVGPVLESNNAQTAALMQAITQGNQAVVAAMTAPKQVVRDETGRPIGVQTVVN